MVATITNQILNDGERNLVVKVQISGDSAGDVTNRLIINVSDFAGYTSEAFELKINRLKANLVSFSAQLLWDADTNVKAYDIVGDRPVNDDFSKYGGLINDAGSGKTGDILISTSGLASGDEGTIVLEMKKRGV